MRKAFLAALLVLALLLPAFPAWAAPVSSSGCTLAPSLTSGEYTVSFQDQVRTFGLDVPTSPGPHPMIVSPHYLFGSWRDARALAAFPTDSLVVLYPQARDGSWGMWDIDPAGPDVAFIAFATSWVMDRLCVDADRVGLAGFSQGAMISGLVACKYPHLYPAGFAPVGGLVDPALLGASCASLPPMWAVHGLRDDVARFDGSHNADVSNLLGDRINSGVDRAATAAGMLRSSCPALSSRASVHDWGRQEVFWCGKSPVGAFLAVKDLGHSWPAFATPWIVDRLTSS